MCGIFAVFNARKAAELTVIGLHNMQHRAIEYAGIVSSDGYNLFSHRGEGIARQVFSSSAVLNRLHGHHALGHIRYSTVTDDPDLERAQPIEGSWYGEPFALAHNGNLTNYAQLKQRLDRPLRSSMDSECIVRLIERGSSKDLIEAVKGALVHLEGSYALCILFPERLLTIQDRSNNKPLSIGTIGDSYIVSSETCAIRSVGARFVRDVEPGEIVVIDRSGVRSVSFAQPRLRKCRFEGNYYSHPSSVTFGEPVDEYRMRLGKALEEHCPAAADIVTAVPDSSMFIAMGYAHSGRSGRYRPVIIRNHYVGRTFIAATQAKRDAEVSQKFNFTEHAIKGRRIVVVDDSIVRGTTLPKIVRQLRENGAKAVHVRIGSPPITYPCLYGINTPTKAELISANKSTSAICSDLGADSLQFLPLQVQKSLSAHPEHFCFACMDGNYWH